jgi:LemA protein
MKRNALLLSILILLSLSAGGCSYNTLQAKHQKVKAGWSNVENQLQRRNDLLNNLIETAKLAGVQEQEVFGSLA